MITQRAKWMIESPSRPESLSGSPRAAMKSSRLIQVLQGLTGVKTFIPYALPAMFDISPPLARAGFRYRLREARHPTLDHRLPASVIGITILADLAQDATLRSFTPAKP